jgi:hypothetical protein
LSCTLLPICRSAHLRQLASSAWNTSNGLPGAGSTITLGPVGTVAQPASASSSKAEGIFRR